MGVTINKLAAGKWVRAMCCQVLAATSWHQSWWSYSGFIRAEMRSASFLLNVKLQQKKNRMACWSEICAILLYTVWLTSKASIAQTPSHLQEKKANKKQKRAHFDSGSCVECSDLKQSQYSSKEKRNGNLMHTFFPRARWFLHWSHFTPCRDIWCFPTHGWLHAWDWMHPFFSRRRETHGSMPCVTTPIHCPAHVWERVGPPHILLQVGQRGSECPIFGDRLDRALSNPI